MTKKIISIILSFIILLFILQANVYAASVPLGSVEVNLSSPKILPGEEVKVNINFGTQLGAYTFDVAYDSSIFDYVSSEGGTANDNGTRVRVTYYDSTGGSNPRENMSVTFKAKSDLESTNPTDFSVTAEGLANSDASQSYDDITSPIKKSITVEPNYVDYTINLKYSGEVISGNEKNMELITESSMGRNYDHVGMTVEITKKPSDDATVKLLATERTRQEIDLVQDGWGEPSGYKLGGKDAKQILDIRGIFSQSGEYTIKITLKDKDSSNAVIATKDFNVSVANENIVEEPGEDNNVITTPPADNENTSNNDVTGGITDNNNQNNNAENLENGAEKLPENLPKTGETRYAFIISLLTIMGCSYVVLKNVKKD